MYIHIPYTHLLLYQLTVLLYELIFVFYVIFLINFKDILMMEKSEVETKAQEFFKEKVRKYGCVH